MNGKQPHGFRKFYKTRAEQVMRPINVEITMGHNIGISASYYKPTEQEVLEDYLRAVDLLTIHGNEQKLMKQVAELQGKSKNNEYIINGKLEEKEEQFEKSYESRLLGGLINSRMNLPYFVKWYSYKALALFSTQSAMQ